MTSDRKLWCMMVAAWAGLGCAPAEQLDPGNPWTIDDVAPVVAVRGSEALAGWHQRSPNQVRVSRYLSGSGWDATSVIATGTHPEVALSSSGYAYALSIGAGGLQVNKRTAGVWGASLVLDSSLTSFSTAGHFIATDGSGNAFAIWKRDGIRAKVHQIGVGWRPTVVLAPSGEYVRVVANESGAAVAAWCTGSSISVANYASGSGWSAVSTSGVDCCAYNGPEFHVSPISLTMSASGNAMVVASNTNRVCSRRYAPATGWTAASVIAQPDASSPQVAMNATGQAIAVWRQDVVGGGRTLRLRAYDPATGWAATVSGPSVVNAPLGVGINSDGNGAAVYRFPSFRGHIAYVGYNVATGQVGDPVAMGEEGVAAYALRVGYDPVAGNGITVWQSAANEETWAARFGL